MSKTTDRLADLVARGFDGAYIIRGGMIRPKCSQCEALVINGIAAHETGCSNARHACAGCDAMIPTRQRYCEDCA